MKKNMGNADRIIRIVLAAVVAVLYFTNIITGNLGIILLVVAGVFVLTSLVSFCPLYRLVGLNTCPVKNSQILK
jgi:putative copper export protein